ncbi:uncharacterized protein LOC126380271 [Pectinophora gossypiella]|uniref:uncharacterized protein LOC126380271 n=1 Tax=Pectinophora gossypiella TaxID=13191 RepID=UPI00214F3184|nr:uncharacterized protein LOC126380271 [Pectinophora gossypiella]
MGPKGKAKEADDTFWRARIEEAQLSEETWKVKVILLEAAGSEQARIYLNNFETMASEERRFVVKNICKTETIFMVNQLGSDKKIKDANLRVFEEGQAFLREKKDIPTDIMALIIKHLILKMKEEYLFIRRQKLEVREGLRRESLTMIEKGEVRGTASSKAPESERSAPTTKKGKGKSDEPAVPEPVEGKKYNTVLRERGEEWRDRVYVDDFPTDGPNVYVAVTGFLDPNLPWSLVRIGIPLTAVVQVRIDPSVTKVPSNLNRPTKRGQSITEIMTEKALKFWADLQDLRINKNYADDFKNTAFVMFNPPYWESEALSGNPDKIYDEVCYLMYDVQDLSRQHVNYLENMDIIHIQEGEDDERYVTYYKQQISDIPLECVTVYSVLDSILQTASAENFDANNSRSSLSAAVTLNQSHHVAKDLDKISKVKTFVKDVFNTLCKTEADKKKYRVSYGEEYETHKDPIVIKYGDYAKYPTFHLGNMNLDNIVGSALFGMPLHNLWQTQNPPLGEIEAKLNFHVNALLSCFDREDVETAELERLIHILACRKLYNNRSSLKKPHLPSSTIYDFKKVYLKRSILAEPLPKPPSLQKIASGMPQSFPSMTKSEEVSRESIIEESDSSEFRLKLIFDCPDISELVSAAEIANNRPITHMIDDFEFFEDFFGTCAFQILFEVFNKFNCVDYKYCEVTDCILLMFFNSHDKDGISREEWRCHIPTPLCLQDFFDFVLEENYDWIENQEKNYEANLLSKRQSECQDLTDPFAKVSCLEDTQVDADLLVEGSLKHQEMLQMEESEQEAPPGSQSSKTTKVAASSPNSTDAESKSSRKQKSMETTPRKGQSFAASRRSLVPDPNKPKKPFAGYDLSDRRVEAFGKDTAFFSKDGTRVATYYVLLIPMNVEYILLNIVPGNGSNEIWVHRALGDFVSPEIRNDCESFRINTKDNVMMNIKKQTYQAPIVLPTSTTDVSKPRESKPRTSPSVAEPDVEPQFETKDYFSFCVTWPNGLITESVHDLNSPDISHIKQFHTEGLPHLDEAMRCISLNGEVIVFKESGDIEVLRPDGTYIYITKYEKRIVVPETREEPSDTSAKQKAKPKGKEKAKPSKNVVEEVIVDEPPPEYKLYIEEFEIIETSGLRQKWINEDSFDIEKLTIRTATEYCLGEIFSRRMDGTSILLNQCGIQIVSFPNKTRIITHYIVEDEEIFPEWTEEELRYFEVLELENDTVRSKASISQKSYTSSHSDGSQMLGNEEEEKVKTSSDGYISVQIIYTIEHANFTTVSIDKSNGSITVTSPNDTSLMVNTQNKYELNLDSRTIATYNGENLHISYEACPQCKSYTTCNVQVKTYENDLPGNQCLWARLKDSFCKKILIDGEGSIRLIDEPCSQETMHHAGSEDTEHTERTENTESMENPEDPRKVDWKSESSVTSHGKCRELYQAKNYRFLILKRDLTCSELIHRTLLQDYEKVCRWQPWCFINQYDTFGDNRTLQSILMPVNVTETEKWLMSSSLSNKPKHLTYKDLKKDTGKGFYHWMRPYERFEPQPVKHTPDVLTHRLPRAFILRTLEQQWRDKDREQLKGAKELLVAILRYRRMMESDSDTLLHIPIVDLRGEDERKTDEIIQAIAHRVYTDLKNTLRDDVEAHAQLTITTEPMPPPEEISVEEEEYVYIGNVLVVHTDPLRQLEEERESLVKEVEEASKMSPELQKYWRRRAEELKEEEFFLYLLREGGVPQYFRNILGGAIWWEMNSTAGDAVTTSERKKMKCVCAEEECTSARTATDNPPSTGAP